MLRPDRLYALLLGLLLLPLAPFELFAQVAQVCYKPLAESEILLRSAAENSTEYINLPPVDSAAIYMQEEFYQSRQYRSAYPFAIGRKLDYHPTNSGRIRQLGDRYVWTLSLRSEGAFSLGLLFGEYHLTPEARLFVYSPWGDLRGAFTEQNNSPSGLLAIAPIAGDCLTVECSWPASQGCGLPEGLKLRITELNHAYKDLGRLREHGVGEPWHTTSGLGCAPNVLTYPEMDRQARSTLLIVVNGKLVCSGVLVNNTSSDGTPYVLSASHCFNNSFAFSGDDKRSALLAQTSVFFFGFDSPSRRQFIRGTEEFTLSGADLVAFDEARDMALLRISGMPKDKEGRELPIPPSYRPYYAGWNLSLAPSAPYVCIHHPLSAVKRYSRSDIPISVRDFNGGNYAWHGVHWYIKQWQVGTTAPGSSGAPLFDANGLIIGALSGGNSYCYTPRDDFFWALPMSWKSQDPNPMRSLADKLDKAQTSATLCRGYDPYAPHSAVRVSRLRQASPNAALEHNASMSAIPTGVGTSYHFDSKVRILGAYVVLAPMRPLQQVAFKKYNLSIHTGKKNEPLRLVHLNEVREPSYSFYNRANGGFDRAARTVGDTLDLFLPILTEDGDNYIDVDGNFDVLCGVSTDDGRPMDLPILRSIEESRAPAAAYHRRVGGDWIPATFASTPYRGSYWIDLLVQPIGLQQGLPDPEIVEIRQYGSRVLIQLPFEDLQPQIDVRIFDYAGRLCYKNGFRSSMAVIELDRVVLPGFYILSVKYKGKMRNHKIVLSN